MVIYANLLPPLLALICHSDLVWYVSTISLIEAREQQQTSLDNRSGQQMGAFVPCSSKPPLLSLAAPGQYLVVPQRLPTNTVIPFPEDQEDLKAEPATAAQTFMFVGYAQPFQVQTDISLYLQLGEAMNSPYLCSLHMKCEISRDMGCLRNYERNLQKTQAQKNCTGERNLKDGSTEWASQR